MLTGRFRYATGYVRGFVTGVRDARTTPADTRPPDMPEPDLEDPDVLLQIAQQEMRENQAKNRERAVQAITAKNNLQAEIDKTQKIVDNLQGKADMARLFGDHDIMRQLLAEKDAYEETLGRMKLSFASAEEAVERVKVGIRREEERIRAKTAQAIALKTQWKEHQILVSLAQTADADPESVLGPLRAELKSLLLIVQQTDADLQRQAEQALLNGNRDLARALMAERGAFRNALSV